MKSNRAQIQDSSLAIQHFGTTTVVKIHPSICTGQTSHETNVIRTLSLAELCTTVQ